MQLGHIANRDYKLTLPPGNSVGIYTGVGVDMSDPLAPKFRIRVFGAKSALAEEPPADSIIDRCTVFEQNDYREEAKSLAIAFSAKYGITDGSAAYSKAKREIETKKIFYIEIASEGAGNAIDGGAIHWSSPPVSEKLNEPQEIRDQFLLDYGSHYISRVYFGKLIIIRATIETSDVSEHENFSASIKAVAASWSGSGSVSSTHELLLRSAKVEVIAAVISGGITGTTLALTSYDDIKNFLASIKSGAIKIANGPIRCDVTSFWHTLSAYPKSRKALSFPVTRPIPATNGVPQGAIISWYPPDESVVYEADDPQKIKTIIAPEGWTVCDGNNGTPNLVGNFIRGAVATADIGLSSGSSSHSHAIAGYTSGETNGHRGPAEGADNGGGDNWEHQHYFSFTTPETSNIPPFVGLLFLMKI